MLLPVSFLLKMCRCFVILLQKAEFSGQKRRKNKIGGEHGREDLPRICCDPERGAAACHGLYRADRRGVLRGAGPQDARRAAGDGRGACEREHHQKRQERHCAEYERPARHCGGRSGGYRFRQCRRAAAGACEPHAGAGGCGGRLSAAGCLYRPARGQGLRVRHSGARHGGNGQRFRRDRGLSHERDPYREKRRRAVSQGLSGVRQPACHRPQSADGRADHCLRKRGGHCRRAGDAPAAD